MARGPVPFFLDVTVPSVARVYDVFLDGKDNFAADRAVARSALKIAPDGPAHPQDAEKAREVQKLFNETLGTCLWRDDSEILAWFGDWELLEPGLVPLPDWRPDTPGPPARDSTYHGFVAGVARKR